ncbi:chitin synthase-domain-containing protein [Aspergillus karnatakaensis]|uniref:putative chitin synthase n=1 Tax=Aspergillus karnatakaensis TaxID=1810916 RepID=UPI003CCD09A4
MSNRFSVYSTQSAGLSGARPSNQVSTTSLLNALHAHYTSGLSYQLDAGSSLVVNSWLTAASAGPDGHIGGTLDRELATRAWEHARRRAEDGCIVLCSTHQSTPSIFEPFLTVLPLSTPSVTFTALSALNPFLRAVTSFSPSYSLYSAFSANFTFTLKGDLVALTLALSTSGINVRKGLLDIPTEPGYRAFDVFYYLLTSSSTQAEREFLALKEPSAYALLNKSGTYSPPSYIPTADDAAAAEDFRAALKAIGIKGASLRNLLSVLAGLLKLGNAAGFLVDQEELEETCEEVGDLLGVDPEILLHKCATDERELLITGIYEALVDWVIGKANEAISSELQELSANGSGGQWSDDDTVSIAVVDIPRPAFGKAVALRNVFDDNVGINAEMKEDGVPAPPVGQAITAEMAAAAEQFAPDLGLNTDPAREYELDKRQGVLEKIGIDLEVDSFLRQILTPVENQGIAVGKKGRFDLASTLGSSRVWHHISVHPSDDLPETLNPALPTAAWSAGVVSRQIREWRLAEWANRRLKQFDFTADFDVDEFVSRYARLGCADGRDGVESWLMQRGWTNGDAFVGHQRIWMRENAWWEAETMIDLKPDEPPSQHSYNFSNSMLDPNYISTPMAESTSLLGGSRDNLLRQSTMAPSMIAKSVAPSVHPTTNMVGDYGLGNKGDDKKWDNIYYDGDPEHGKHIEKSEITLGRRLWTGFVWALTFWIPSFVLQYIGRMKRPDVRMAWREKVILVILILLFNGIVCFYIIAFGDLLCPNKDKAWNEREVSWHSTSSNFYVSIHGWVYDITKFAKVTHGDVRPEATPEYMLPLAGMNLDAYFPPPLTRMCGAYVDDEVIALQNNDTAATQEQPLALHTVGRLAPTGSALREYTWYEEKFLPKIKEYQKGKLVWTRGTVKKQAENSDQRKWVIAHNKVYDFTDYFYTVDRFEGNDEYKWLPEEITTLVKDHPGEDVSDKWPLESRTFSTAQPCLDYVFYKGETDFRESARCTVNNWILLAFTILICAVILIKFFAALQLGSKRRPAPQDKFVICMVPAYTEGEDSLRKGLDSLTALQYDNKRKLIFVICDGMIVGGGNDRPTPKIVLDILGVDPKIDPPALPVKCIGQGSDQLNYGKVYSGLYEYEGNVVPYVVVVKVGKESEQSKSKPGNRGKRDSQVMLLNFLNRVHHRAPMSPLELEIFHQINNVIGVDPELYEYCLMVDADTSVREDSLNRLVAACANDARIAGICGETSLQNEERSWWTMIQVYEYYISHHLAKAFESLFGSVTCLPGCFCMYRLRTADRGRPLIISDKVLEEYADINVDTLHKKNLLSLGEDRYLTTLMTKHFPSMSYKFIPDAYASTAAPETWSVLLSQRRRWINSTVHNLVELAALKDLCGFCCFSMRFVVMVDLLGTLILPATCVYLGYLIYLIASDTGPFPMISIIMLAGVYGLQAIIFIVKRQWQHIGWMIIYLCAYPIYSFVLPLYSFWKQDDFSWGNTRVVIGEKGSQRVVAVEDEPFDPRSIPLQRWDDYALANNLPGRRGDYAVSQEKGYFGARYMDDTAMEMDDMHSQYSSVKPASTILTGFPGQGRHSYIPPQSPAAFGGNTPGNRNSHFSTLSRYTDQPLQGNNIQARHMSMGNLSQLESSAMTTRHSVNMMQSTDNLLSIPNRSSRSPVGGLNSRPASAFDFRGQGMNGPDEASITEAIRGCLSEVDLDTVTKKQVRALVEQRLQTTLVGDKRAFLDRQIDNELANM